MAGKTRPALRQKTLENVMESNLSVTDKGCIKAVFEKMDSIVNCKDCNMFYPESSTMLQHCTLSGVRVCDNDYCSYGERRCE